MRGWAGVCGQSALYLWPGNSADKAGPFSLGSCSVLEFLTLTLTVVIGFCVSVRKGKKRVLSREWELAQPVVCTGLGHRWPIPDPPAALGRPRSGPCSQPRGSGESSPFASWG